MVTLQALEPSLGCRPLMNLRDCDVAMVSLGAWRMRGVEKPYQFGHGRRFKIIKWPPTFGVYGLLDTVSRYRQLWRGANAARQMCAHWPSSPRAW
jgi:hypothetical protein